MPPCCSHGPPRCSQGAKMVPHGAKVEAPPGCLNGPQGAKVEAPGMTNVSLAYKNCVAAVRENGVFHSGVLAFEGALFVQRRCKTQMLTRGDLASRSRARSVAHTCMTPGVTRRCCTRASILFLAPFFEPRGQSQTPRRSTRHRFIYRSSPPISPQALRPFVFAWSKI